LEKKLLPLHHRLNKQTINRESVFYLFRLQRKELLWMAGATQWSNGTTMSRRSTWYIASKTGSCGRSGRTDAGVHARLMVAHFDWETEITDLSHLAGKLNRLLPKDIAVYNIVPVVSDAHARFSATSRTYNYYITDKKDPFNHETVYKLPVQPDFAKMNEACKELFKYTDFTSLANYIPM